MKVTWLGQAGLYVEAGGLSIVIDPYLSDSIGEKDPTKHRKQPVEEWMLALQPDVLALKEDRFWRTSLVPACLVAIGFCFLKPYVQSLLVLAI